MLNSGKGIEDASFIQLYITLSFAASVEEAFLKLDFHATNKSGAEGTRSEILSCSLHYKNGERNISMLLPQ